MAKPAAEFPLPNAQPAVRHLHAEGYRLWTMSRRHRKQARAVAEAMSWAFFTAAAHLHAWYNNQLLDRPPISDPVYKLVADLAYQPLNGEPAGGEGRPFVAFAQDDTRYLDRMIRKARELVTPEKPKKEEKHEATERDPSAAAKAPAAA